MNRLQYLLCKLAEEASEVAQIALKTSYYGLDEVYEVKTNKERIHNELNDLVAIIEMLNDEVDFDYLTNSHAIMLKKDRVNQYYHYSKRLGMVE